MTTPRTLASYASPKANARPLANPTNSITQTEWNRLVGDAAALCTCAPPKLIVQFPTLASAGAVVPSAFWAQWGLDPASAPVITRTSTAGVYTIATPVAWTTPGTWSYMLDPAGQVSTNEPIIWQDIEGGIFGDVASTSAGFVRGKLGANAYTFNVYVYNSSWTLSDLGGSIPIRVVAR
jgi:hypothetical protein